MLLSLHWLDMPVWDLNASALALPSSWQLTLDPAKLDMTDVTVGCSAKAARLARLRYLYGNVQLFMNKITLQLTAWSLIGDSPRFLPKEARPRRRTCQHHRFSHFCLSELHTVCIMASRLSTV